METSKKKEITTMGKNTKFTKYIMKTEQFWRQSILKEQNVLITKKTPKVKNILIFLGKCECSCCKNLSQANELLYEMNKQIAIAEIDRTEWNGKTIHATNIIMEK